MAQEWILAHIGKKGAGKWPEMQKAWWLRRKNSARSNPKRGGISEGKLLAALGEFEGDDLEYLGGLSRVWIEDRDLEEFYLERILLDDELVEDWEIILLMKEMVDEGPHGWNKVLIHNTKTGKYSGRSFHKYVDRYDDPDYFRNKLKSGRVARLAQNKDWFVEWTKLAADKSFWLTLKDIVTL